MINCGDGPIEVLHMMPCNDTGWRAVFNTPNAEKPWSTPVIAWLWVEHGDEQHGHPMVALAGEILDAATVANYVGVAAPGENEETLVRTAPSATQQRLAAS